MRLSRAVAARLPVVPVEGPNSGVATAALDPWSATPRKLPPLPIGTGWLFALELAGRAGGAADADERVAPRGSGVFDVKPGGGVFVPGGGEVVPDGGAVVPDDRQAGDADDDDGGQYGSVACPAAAPVAGGGIRVRPTRNGSEVGACPWLAQPASSSPIRIGAK
jgi:hypothetical protein